MSQDALGLLCFPMDDGVVVPWGVMQMPAGSNLEGCTTSSFAAQTAHWRRAVWPPPAERCVAQRYGDGDCFHTRGESTRKAIRLACNSLNREWL